MLVNSVVVNSVVVWDLYEQLNRDFKNCFIFNLSYKATFYYHGYHKTDFFLFKTKAAESPNYYIQIEKYFI